MFRIDCIPLKKGLERETLSYFSAKGIKIGSLVSVPVRSQKIPALITNTSLLVESKLSLKDANFALKKLGAVKTEMLYFEETLEAANRVAERSLGSVGSLLPFFTPRFVLEEGHGTKAHVFKKKVYSEKYFFQASEEDRLLEYRGLIRERFARGESVFICFPTIEESTYFFEELSRGIEDFAFLFESALTKKHLQQTWKEALHIAHPILIVGTPLFLTIPRHDLSLIIIEHESSRFYKQLQRPYPDARIAAELLAESYGATFILSDTAVRVETLKREEDHTLERIGATKMRVGASTESMLVDMRHEQNGEKKDFAIISKELKSFIGEGLENNERTFLFASRRGLSPLTVCNDCGAVVLCLHCGAPVVLHGEQEKAHFLCHHCGERRTALEGCRTCTGWNLKPLGIGVERVEEEVKKLFPEANVYVLTSDTAKNSKVARELVTQYMHSPAGILIGTEFALTYLHKKIERSAIVSLDSFFALPDFKINERVFWLLSYIKQLTRYRFLIQTRRAELSVFGNAVRGDTMNFYREELKMRELFKWPPYYTIVKISVEAVKDKAIASMETLMQTFSDVEPEVFPAFVPGKQGTHILHMLLRLKGHSQVSEKILKTLAELPREYRIEIDPESIL
jgi:primosomal protein N' (replication factor Y)